MNHFLQREIDLCLTHLRIVLKEACDKGAADNKHELKCDVVEMVPWGEILECYNLDIWILVLDLKNELMLIFNGKQSYLGQIPENKVPCS